MKVDESSSSVGRRDDDGEEEEEEGDFISTDFDNMMMCFIGVYFEESAILVDY
jgi:hypothetical protein